MSEVRWWLCLRCGDDFTLPVAAHPRDYCSACKKRRQKNHDLMRRFRMSEQEYRALIAHQEHRCAICGVHEDEVRRGVLDVDHDPACCKDRPSCGKCTRGAVCHNCNMYLMHFEAGRNVRPPYEGWLDDARAYLAAPPARILA